MRTLDAAQLYDMTFDWLRWLLEDYSPGGMTFDVPRKGQREEQHVSRDYLEAFQHALEADRAHVERVLSLEPERYHKLGDIVLQTGFFFSALYEPAPPDLITEAAKVDRDLAAAFLREYLDWYTGEEAAEEWEAKMDAMWQSRGLKRGMPFMTLRVAITGTRQTPPLFPVVQVLGPEEVRRRVQEALARLEP